MNKFSDLYEFIDIAKKNRKYPENTANGLKSALKIFEKQLNLDELNSVDTIEENIEEIFLTVVSANKDKSIGSLNTYKARLMKVIVDYQKYGIDPSKMQGWHIAAQKLSIPKNTHKDIQDKNPDKYKIALSDPVNTPVHKIELALRDRAPSVIMVPKNLTKKEADMIKSVIDSLIENS